MAVGKFKNKIKKLFKRKPKSGTDPHGPKKKPRKGSSYAKTQSKLKAKAKMKKTKK